MSACVRACVRACERASVRPFVRSSVRPCLRALYSVQQHKSYTLMNRDNLMGCNFKSLLCGYKQVHMSVEAQQRVLGEIY